MSEQVDSIRRHPSPPNRKTAETPRRPYRRKITEDRGHRFTERAKQEYLLLNAAHHDIRSPLVHLWGNVELLRMNLTDHKLNDVASIDSAFDYDHLLTAIDLVSTVVTENGRLSYDVGKTSGVKTDTVAQLTAFARDHMAPDELLRQIGETKLTGDEITDILIVNQMRDKVNHLLFVRNVAKLDDPELTEFVRDTRPKQPIEIRAFFHKAITLLQKDVWHLFGVTVPAVDRYLRYTPHVRDKVSPDDLAHLLAFTQRVETSTKVLIPLLESSLKFIDLSQIDFTQDRKQLTVTDLIHQVVAANDYKLNRTKKVCEVREYVPPDGTIFAHPDTVRVLETFMSNAIKYAASHISVNTLDLGDHIMVCVSDDGKGLVSGDVPRIFKAGVQGASAVKSSGIGLFMAQKIINDQGGIIDVDFEPQKGSAFYFVLPKSPNSAPISDEIRVTAREKASGLRETLTMSVPTPVQIKEPELAER